MKVLTVLVVLAVLVGASQAVHAGPQALAGWNMPPVAEDDGEAIRQQCGQVDVLANDWDPENGELVLVEVFYFENLELKNDVGHGGTIPFCLPAGKRAGRLGYLVADDQGMMDVGYLYVYWL